MDRILVAGGAGFIGLHVLERLRAGRIPLRVVVRTDAGKRQLAAAGFKPGKGLQIAVADLSQRLAVPELLEGCSHVIHLAGRVSSRRADRRLMYRDNLHVTAHLLEWALEANVRRFVHVSHAIVLGCGTEKELVTEAAPFDSKHFPGDYVQARRLADLEAMRALARGLPVILPTPTFCLGPGDNNRGSGLFLGPFRAGFRWSPPGGLNVVDVRDAATGIVSALEQGEPGERYLLGGTNVNFRALFGRLSDLAGKPPTHVPLPPLLARAAAALAERFSDEPLLTAVQAAFFGHFWYYDHAKAHRKLAYQPRPLEETLRDAAASAAGSPASS